MAERLSQFGVAIDTREVKAGQAQFSRSVDDIKRKAGQGTAATNTLTRSFDSAGKQMRDFARLAGSVFGVITFTAAIGGAIQLADAYRNLRSRLQLVTRDSYELTRAQKQLYDVSQNTRSALETTATLYTRIARNSKQLGTSQAEVLRTTDAVSKAMIISGESTQSANAAMIQLGQALASGVLRGDEFRSIMEQAPRLSQALSDSLGVTTGKLREMAFAGELSAKTVVRAILSQADALDKEFERMPVTVSGAMTRVRNAMVRYIGEVDQARGATAGLAQGLTLLSKNLELIVEIGKIAAVFFAARWVASFVAARKMAIDTFVAVSEGNAVMLNGREAARQKAAAVVEAAALERKAAEQRVAALKIEQAAIRETMALERTRIAQAQATVARKAVPLHWAWEQPDTRRNMRNQGEVLVAMKNEAAATKSLEASRGRLLVINQQLSVANKTLAVTTNTVAAAQRAMVAVTNFMSAAMARAAAVARAMWAAIGGLPGAILIGLYALYTLMNRSSDSADRLRERADKAAEGMAKLREEIEKLNTAQLMSRSNEEADKLIELRRAADAAAAALRAEESKKLSEYGSTGGKFGSEAAYNKREAALRKLKLALEEANIAYAEQQAILKAVNQQFATTSNAQVDAETEAQRKFRATIEERQAAADKLRAVNQAYGQSEIALKKLEIRYDAQQQKARTEKEYTGARLAQLNAITDAMTEQQLIAVDLANDKMIEDATRTLRLETEAMRSQLVAREQGAQAMEEQRIEQAALVATQGLDTLSNKALVAELAEAARARERATIALEKHEFAQAVANRTTQLHAEAVSIAAEANMRSQIATRGSAEAEEMLRVMLAGETEVRRALNDAQEKGLKLTEEEIKKLREAAEAREQANVEAEREQRIRQFKKSQAELAAQPLENALKGLQEAASQVFQNIVDQGVQTFKDFADIVKQIFIKLAAELLAMKIGEFILGKIKLDAQGAPVLDASGNYAREGGLKKILGSKAFGMGAGALVGGLTGYETGSPFAGVVSGAATGAALGGAPGAIVGAIAGLVGGLFGGAKRAREAAEQMRLAREAFTEQLEQFVAAASGGATAFSDAQKEIRDKEEQLVKDALLLKPKDITRSQIYRELAFSSNPREREAAARMMEEYTKKLAEYEDALEKIGVSAEQLVEKLRQEVIGGIERQINELEGKGYINAWDDIFKSLQDNTLMLEQAGGDTSRAFDLFRLQFDQLVDSLSDEQFAEFLEVLPPEFRELAATLRDVSEVVGGLTEDGKRLLQDMSAREMILGGDYRGAAEQRLAQQIAEAEEQARAMGFTQEQIQRLIDLINNEFVAALAQIEKSMTEDLAVRRLSAQGRTREAEELSRQIAQQRELEQARAQGVSDEVLAMIEQVHALEDLATARQKEIEAARLQEDLITRHMRAMGYTREADERAMQLEQQRELQALIESGADAAAIALLELIHAEEYLAYIRAREAEEVRRNAEIRDSMLSRREELLIAHGGQNYDDARFERAQRQERERARAEGWTNEQLKDLFDTQTLESFARVFGRETEGMIAAIEQGTQAQLDRQDQLIEAAQHNLQAVQESSSVARENLSLMKRAADALHSLNVDFRTTIAPGRLSPLAALTGAQGEYQALLSRAQGGDAVAAADLPEAANRYLELAQMYFGSTDRFAAIFKSVSEATAALESQYSGRASAAETAVAVATQQLEAARRQVDELQAQRATIEDIGQQQIEELRRQREAQFVTEFRALEEQLAQTTLLEDIVDNVQDTASQSDVLMQTEAERERQANDDRTQLLVDEIRGLRAELQLMIRVLEAQSTTNTVENEDISNAVREQTRRLTDALVGVELG